LLTGVTSLPFLSYESIFLYQFAVDAGISPGPPPETKNCCRLQTSNSLTNASDFSFAEFCVRFGMLLAAIKIEDDVRDNGSMISKLVNWTYRTNFQESFAYFEKLDQGFESNLRQIINEHFDFEQTSASISLHEYVRPTANAFGYVFSLLAELFPNVSASTQIESNARNDREDTFKHYQEILRLVGEHIGSAIISFDCAVDFQKDRWRGEYNPLQDTSDVHAALDFCGDQLVAAGWKCRESFGDQARTVRLLKNRFDSLCCRYDSCQRPPIQSRLDQWGLIRQPGHTYARCDGGCCEVFAACGACGCTDVPIVCCCCDSLECFLCTENVRRRKDAREERPISELVGEIGVTQTAMRPSGTVSIGGQRIPAKTQGEFINGGEKVVLLSEDAFGAIVRRVEPRV